MNRSHLRPSEQFRQLQADFQQSLLTSDRSHLERPLRDDSLSSRAPQDRHQIALDIRSKARLSAHLVDLDARGLYRIFDADLDAYVLAVKPAGDPNEQYQIYTDFEASAYQQKREAETKLSIEAVAGPEGFGCGTEDRFNAKKPQALRSIDTKRAINLYISGLDGSSPETAENVWFSNTQTRDGRPTLLRINKTDFLAR
ncbi:MAG: hypothetical protein QX199_11545 [Methylococcaceae bacterium]